jgi:hypothetical protein
MLTAHPASSWSPSHNHIPPPTFLSQYLYSIAIETCTIALSSLAIASSCARIHHAPSSYGRAKHPTHKPSQSSTSSSTVETCTPAFPQSVQVHCIKNIRLLHMSCHVALTFSTYTVISYEIYHKPVEASRVARNYYNGRLL